MVEDAEYTLRYPFDGIEKVTVRRVRGRDLVAISKAKTEDEATMLGIAALTGLTVQQAEDLDGTDFVLLGEVVRGFFEAVQTETRTASAPVPSSPTARPSSTPR